MVKVANAVLYTPNIVPSEPAEYRRFLAEELQKISASIAAVAAGHLDPTYVAPAKPREGDIRYADGTSWNPGGTGKGPYYYNGSAWVKM